jgi:putative sugar O-methyltransferase
VAALNQVRRLTDSILGRANLALVRRSALHPEATGPSYIAGPLPPGAEERLRANHPRLLDLERRYRGHPASPHPIWQQDAVSNKVTMQYFRGDNLYLWQVRARLRPEQYAVTMLYTEHHDPLDLLATLSEDGLFGAHTFNLDGRAVSRDLLDSITELTFLQEEMGITSASQLNILDIGAGYGRLAHRATTAMPKFHYFCADAVPLSTFLSEYYLHFRGCSRATVIPLDNIRERLAGRRIDLAVNIHSFSECPIAAISWWLDILAANDVGHLMIVPNKGTELSSFEPTGMRRDYRPIIESRGFELVVQRPKYAHSRMVQEYGVNPTTYFLFRRH